MLNEIAQNIAFKNIDDDLKGIIDTKKKIESDLEFSATIVAVISALNKRYHREDKYGYFDNDIYMSENFVKAIFNKYLGNQSSFSINDDAKSPLIELQKDFSGNEYDIELAFSRKLSIFFRYRVLNEIDNKSTVFINHDHKDIANFLKTLSSYSLEYKLKNQLPEKAEKNKRLKI